MKSLDVGSQKVYLGEFILHKGVTYRDSSVMYDESSSQYHYLTGL